MNVYVFDVVDSSEDIEVAILASAKPDETPVVMRRFHGTSVHDVFCEIAKFVSEERRKRLAPPVYFVRQGTLTEDEKTTLSRL